eukprot:scaffold22572_cov98-Cylindrotheca_fusiformis.AAC.1
MPLVSAMAGFGLLQYCVHVVQETRPVSALVLSCDQLEGFMVASKIRNCDARGKPSPHCRLVLSQ